MNVSEAKQGARKVSHANTLEFMPKIMISNEPMQTIGVPQQMEKTNSYQEDF